MGYSTEFTGHVTVDPPLNGPEMDYLRRFASADINVILPDDRDGPRESWECKWEPTDDGLGLRWNGREKFTDGEKWMQYLIDTYLKPGTTLQLMLANPATAATLDPAFRHFTFNHVVSGRIEAQGEDADDRWTLAVVDNVVSKVKFPTLAERMDTDAQLRAAFETLREAGVTVAQYAKQTGQDY